MTTDRFTGKVAFVTGAGSGIGQAVALRLAAENGIVVGADIDPDGLADTVARCADAPGTFEPVELDIGDRAACFAAIEGCVARRGRLDVLGNIAGVVHAGHFIDTPEDAYRRLMRVNVDGMFFLSQAALPHLVASGGSLINTASNSALQGVAYLVAYSTTKTAIIGFTKSLAMEYVKTGVRINCIAPGGTLTGLTRNFSMPADVDPELAIRPAGFRGINTPEEVAALFAFVASDEAPGIHGAVLPIDRAVTTG
jgi:NAD(P)-dependent dehydrogenase (short-subunit alcohol dehydrogenase family)